MRPCWNYSSPHRYKLVVPVGLAPTFLANQASVLLFGRRNIDLEPIVGVAPTQSQLTTLLPPPGIRAICWRSGSDLNRRGAGCSRVPSRSVTRSNWSEWQDSNLRILGSKPRRWPDFRYTLIVGTRRWTRTTDTEVFNLLLYS